MKITKYIGIGTVIWLMIFVVDSINELFKINETSEVTTLTGLRMNVSITPEELYTAFSLTWQALFMYLAFIVVFTTIAVIIHSIKRKKTYDH